MQPVVAIGTDLAYGAITKRSLASIGIVMGHPAHLTVEGGRLTKATGPEGERLYALLTGRALEKAETKAFGCTIKRA